MFKPSDFSVTLRNVKGEQLTYEEMDRNFSVMVDMFKYSISKNGDRPEEFIALMHPVGVFNGGDIPAQDEPYVAYIVGDSIVGRDVYVYLNTGVIFVYDENFNTVRTIYSEGNGEIPIEAKYISCLNLLEGARIELAGSTTDGGTDGGSDGGSDGGTDGGTDGGSGAPAIQ